MGLTGIRNLVAPAALAAFLFLLVPGAQALSVEATSSPEPSKLTVIDPYAVPLFGQAGAQTESLLTPGPGDYHMFGVNPARQHSMVSRIRPPFEKVWSVWEGELIEFPPAIAGDYMYSTNKTGSVRAIDISTGKTVWTHQVRSFDQTDPVYSNGRVFVALNDGTLFALDAGTGRKLWTFKARKDIESSPTPAGGVLAIGDDGGNIYGLNPATGRKLWRFRTDDDVKASASYGNGRLVIADYSGNVIALNPKTGKKIWERQTSNDNGPGFYSSPAVTSGRVFIGRTDGMMFSLRLRNGAVAWSRQLNGRLYGSPAVASTPGTQESVYVGTHGGYLYGLSATTGAQRWRYDIGGPIPGTASVVGNLVYASTFNEDKGTNGYTVGIDPKRGKKVLDLGKRSWGNGGYTPVITDNLNLFVIGYKRITAYRMKGN